MTTTVVDLEQWNSLEPFSPINAPVYAERFYSVKKAPDSSTVPTTPLEVLRRCRALDVRLRAEGPRLRYNAPADPGRGRPARLRGGAAPTSSAPRLRRPLTAMLRIQACGRWTRTVCAILMHQI